MKALATLIFAAGMAILAVPSLTGIEMLSPLYILAAVVTGAAGITAYKYRGSLRVQGIHGTSEWASTSDIRKTRLRASRGVVLAQTGARFSDTKNGYKLRRPGELLVHDGPEHICVIAPTRSGKGVGVVIPTLTYWPHSAIILDIKKELWNLTSGHRDKFTHAIRFEPADEESAAWNPLAEIRPAPHDVQDAQLIASILVDPEGTGKQDHWQKTAFSLLTALILYVHYELADKSLRGILTLITDPESGGLQDVLERMQNHANPIVRQTAQEMLDKPPNEFGSVVSTAGASLTIYRDPIVAGNTSRSDFRIPQIMGGKNPKSVYIVISPADLERLRPLTRLFVAMAASLLMSSSDKKAHRLLFLLDEFPSLGKIELFESALAYAAGYGIKLLIIAQSTNQLEKAYGQNTSILDNCHVKLFYAASDEKSAQRISAMLGKKSIVSTSKTDSKTGGSQSHSETGRSLLDASEILRLPYTEALLIVSGHKPASVNKVMFYTDKRFAPFVGYPKKEEKEAAHATKKE